MNLYMLVADLAQAAAIDAEVEHDVDEAAICREIEADARGMALIESKPFLAAAFPIAILILCASVEGYL